jgi:hypothetical protein
MTFKELIVEKKITIVDLVDEDGDLEKYLKDEFNLKIKFTGGPNGMSHDISGELKDLKKYMKSYLSTDDDKEVDEFIKDSTK